MKPEETVDFHLRWVWAKVARLYNQEAAKHGGTMSIGYILLNIDKEGTNSTKLGPKMGMEPRSLTRTLKTMEESGLIYRVQDKIDKRKVKVFLTEKGQAMREESKNVVVAFNEFVRKRVDTEKFEVFLEVIAEINELCDHPNLFNEPANTPT
ncbi:MarR family winged helix-turn-helix transcriptional regulator [Sanyastnella coralliicola]|uniref:MarR family winged helix-turn-helix transcriptional regulator n=1 Tax=Sanyastnella coralliicola TaxID=3069118 RepID=UPI0027B99BFF|nr:MarR family transcriptional regulator [Longitalea sp. SCSIO 12813]